MSSETNLLSSKSIQNDKMEASDNVVKTIQQSNFAPSSNIQQLVERPKVGRNILNHFPLRYEDSHKFTIIFK